MAVLINAAVQCSCTGACMTCGKTKHKRTRPDLKYKVGFCQMAVSGSQEEKGLLPIKPILGKISLIMPTTKTYFNHWCSETESKMTLNEPFWPYFSRLSMMVRGIALLHFLY